MLVRGIGIRDISAVLRISISKVLKVLKSYKRKITSKLSHYDCLEIDEFWTYVGEKKKKMWLIYRLPPGKRRNSSVCMGKTGCKNSAKVEKENKTAWNKL
jgi:hypothetical protein